MRTGEEADKGEGAGAGWQVGSSDALQGSDSPSAWASEAGGGVLALPQQKGGVWL